MSWASEAAMVDFPSLGSDDVMPTTLFEVFVGFKSIASFIERIDSANADNGMAVAAQYIPEHLEIVLWSNSLSPCIAPPSEDFFCSVSFSSGTSDRQGKCSAASSCADVRKTRSITSLRNPSAVPSAIPPKMPSANISPVLGLLLPCGGEAGEITRASDMGNDSC